MHFDRRCSALSYLVKNTLWITYKFGVFPLFYDLQDGLEWSAPTQSSQTPNKPVIAPVEVVLSELGMHISRERVKQMSTEVFRHFTPAVSLGFYLFQVSWPQVIINLLPFIFPAISYIFLGWSERASRAVNKPPFPQRPESSRMK